MRLVLALDPSAVEITEPLAGGMFPYLLAVGSLRISARAGYLSGIGVGESPSLTVQIDNSGNRAAAIVGQPLRARADVFDGAVGVFSGYVSGIVYGRTIELTIEA